MEIRSKNFVEKDKKIHKSGSMTNIAKIAESHSHKKNNEVPQSQVVAPSESRRHRSERKTEKLKEKLIRRDKEIEKLKAKILDLEYTQKSHREQITRMSNLLEDQTVIYQELEDKLHTTEKKLLIVTYQLKPSTSNEQVLNVFTYMEVLKILDNDDYNSLRNKAEDLLTDLEFTRLFGMSREEFRRLPQSKRDQKKRDYNLLPELDT